MATRRSGVTPIAALAALSRVTAGGCYAGMVGNRPVFAGREQAVLVLGPPRSGKTTGIVVPNVLIAEAVVSVSTKRDVLDATIAARLRHGPCYLFDPSGIVKAPAEATLAGWSPLHAAQSWSGAVGVAEAMVGASHHLLGTAESSHWAERASALLAPLFHAGAIGEASIDEVVSWVQRREPERALATLAQADAVLALDLLSGVTETDPRELSGIWSTASGVLAAYRTQAAIASACRPAMDWSAVLEGHASVYVVAPSEHQRHGAPLVAGLIRELREHVYGAALAQRSRASNVLLVLDELANIAPLHDLPELVSEGGGLGITTIACLQDLSQARHRWRTAGEGFLSLFGTKVMLGGLGDRATLETLSLLLGDHDVPLISKSRLGLSARATTTRTTRRLPRLSPDAIASIEAGKALVLRSTQAARVDLPQLAAPDAGHSARRAFERRGRRGDLSRTWQRER